MSQQRKHPLQNLWLTVPSTVHKMPSVFTLASVTHYKDVSYLKAALYCRIIPLYYIKKEVGSLLFKILVHKFAETNCHFYLLQLSISHKSMTGCPSYTFHSLVQ